MDEEMLVEEYETLESAETVDEVEIQPIAEESALPADVLSDDDSSVVEESEESYNLSETDSDLSGSASGLDSERVQEVVGALLESEQVSGFIRNVETTLATISSALPVGSEEQQEPLEVVSVEEVVARMMPQATETAPVQAASVPAVTNAGGEVLVPGSDELSVIEVVQLLLSYFQEDDNSLITAIRDNTADIKTAVTEIQANTAPHLLMETPFEEYTVLEGLVLILVLWLAVVNPCIKMIKGGFSWLMW